MVDIYDAQLGLTDFTGPDNEQQMRMLADNLPPDDDRPIRLQGAGALFPSLCAFSNKIENSMVDTFV